MATGKFPYKTWVTPFEQLKQVNPEQSCPKHKPLRFHSPFRSLSGCEWRPAEIRAECVLERVRELHQRVPAEAIHGSAQLWAAAAARLPQRARKQTNGCQRLRRGYLESTGCVKMKPTTIATFNKYSKYSHTKLAISLPAHSERNRRTYFLSIFLQKKKSIETNATPFGLNRPSSAIDEHKTK